MDRQATINELTKAVNAMAEVFKERDLLLDIEAAHRNPDTEKIANRRKALIRKENRLDSKIRKLTLALQ